MLKELLTGIALGTIIAAAMLAIVSALHMQSELAPISPMTVASDFSTTPGAPTYPPEIIQAAVAEMTHYAPSPTRTPLPPTVTLVPTMAIEMCGPSAQTGSLCEWPMPTPVADPGPPDCGTPHPGQICVWTGLSAPASTPVLVMQ